MNYQWQKDGISLSNGGNVFGAASSTLVITGVSDSDAASYSVIVTSANGSVTSSNATLTVIDPPVLSVQCVAGNLQVNFTGMVNRNYVIQYCTNLINPGWLILVSVTNLSESPYLFIDPVGVNSPSRFYRVLMQ
jgi:hypothetical protein